MDRVADHPMRMTTTTVDIDQFVWPCDFDSDGIQDYFDDDDDIDGVADISDIHPWDPVQNSSIETALGILWDSWVRWDH
jgi:hypothetical protein